MPLSAARAKVGDAFEAVVVDDPVRVLVPGQAPDRDVSGVPRGLRVYGHASLCSECHAAERPHEPLGECSQCHTALSWKEGIFDHAKAAFAVDGAHLEVSCDQCHDGRFRGVPKDCAGCHAEAGNEAHGDFGACEPCHATTGFTPSSFEHAAVSFPLTGRHAKAPCQECHDAKVEGYREAVTGAK